MAEIERVDVFQFMSLRPPASVDEAVLQRDYIHDAPRDSGKATDVPQEVGGESAIARLVVDEVFCNGSTDDDIVQRLVDLLPMVTVVCADDPPSEDAPAEETTAENSPPRRVGLAALADLGAAHRFPDGMFRRVPDRPEAVLEPGVAAKLARARTEMLMAAKANPFYAQKPYDALSDLFDSTPLVDYVFDGARLAQGFWEHRRRLFDALYTLYILRRRVTIDLGPITAAVTMLHALEWLATDRFLTSASKLKRNTLPPKHQKLLAWLESRLPELRDGGLIPGAPPVLVGGGDDLRRLLTAAPIIHPIFSRLSRLRTPFNQIQPLGVGDLKVVKQWLVEYVPGEISHVATVMKGETNERTTRRLDKTEEQFASMSERSGETTTDTQTTDRLELKREAENVVKTELQARADANLTFKPNTMIQIGVSGSLAYGRSTQDSAKSAQQLAREVIDKAVSRVQTRVTDQRSITRAFENEETVKHGFTNTKGTGHINGFYRFIDKRYCAQLFNYGKRLMFEFIVPEPAGFLVESRLRAFEAATDAPTRPKRSEPEVLNLGFTASQIDRLKWQELRGKYDLSSLGPYPEDLKRVLLVNTETSTVFFEEKDIVGTNDKWWAKSYAVRLDAPGYEIRRVRRSGSLYYVEGHPSGPPRWRDHNFYNLWLNGQLVKQEDHSASDYRAFYTPNDDIDLTSAPIPVVGSENVLALEFQQVKNYALTFSLELAPSADHIAAWRTNVFKAVQAKEQELVDAHNREAELVYNAELADYRRAVQALRATAINDLLQGGAEATNRRVILRELRRLCLAELTKEFDADTSNDRLSDLETVGTWDVKFSMRKPKVTENSDRSVTFGYEPQTGDAKYPATRLDEARTKGHQVQFLEQAFEWDLLGFLFYPYFWATPPKWVDLMSREDDADPTYTAFLQAGSARVLVAVSPGYEDAVIHYLATGEPWDGGEAPVIGDPLYVPLYEELRDETDDLQNATAEGEPWSFVVPTSLVYLDGGDKLPVIGAGAGESS